MSSEHDELLHRFLAEDIGKGDLTGALLPKIKIQARVISRESAVVAGITHIQKLFRIKKCTVKIMVKDGSWVSENQTILVINGYAKDVLACERTALNLLSRMSGIATMTRILVDRALYAKTKIYATRKTAPGLRYFDKEAVEIGGGKKHRMRLDESVMIKDNHVAAITSTTRNTKSKVMMNLIKKAKKNKSIGIEVEVENPQDVLMVASDKMEDDKKEGNSTNKESSKVSIIMLDNFTPNRIKKTIELLKAKGLREHIMLEASGGITEKNIDEYIKTGVDIISIGALTSSVKGIDMSLEI